MDIKTISPAIPERRYPKIIEFKNGRRTRAVSIAPIGSTTPDKKDHRNALPLLPVALYTGADTAIPSGILWMAIAIAMAIPILISTRGL